MTKTFSPLRVSLLDHGLVYKADVVTIRPIEFNMGRFFLPLRNVQAQTAVKSQCLAHILDDKAYGVKLWVDLKKSYLIIETVSYQYQRKFACREKRKAPQRGV